MKYKKMNKSIKRAVLIVATLVMAFVCFSLPVGADATYANVKASAFDEPTKGVVGYKQEYGAATTRFFTYEEEEVVEIDTFHYFGVYERANGDYEDIVVFIAQAAASNARADIGYFSKYSKDKDGNAIGNDLKPIEDLQGTEYAGAYTYVGTNSYTFAAGNVGYFILKAEDMPEMVSGYNGGVAVYMEVFISYKGDELPTEIVRQSHGYFTQNVLNANGSASKSYGFGDPIADISIEQEVSNPDATIGDQVTVTLTVKNGSNMWLDDVVLDIYNAYDDSSKRLSNMSNVTVNGVPIDDIHSIPLGNWEGSISHRPYRGTPVSDDYEDFIITYDYIVSTEDLIGSEVPLRAEVTATSPKHTVDHDTFMDYSYPNIGAPVTHVLPVSDDALDILDIDGLCSVTYDPNTGEGTAYTVVDLIGNTHNVLDNDSNSNLGFTKEGNTFKGWNTQADGEGIMYQADDTFVTVEGNTTVYAIWEENLIPDPTPNPDPDPKNPKAPSDKTLVVTDVKKSGSNLVRTGDTTSTMIFIFISGAAIVIGLKKYKIRISGVK